MDIKKELAEIREINRKNTEALQVATKAIRDMAHANPWQNLVHAEKAFAEIRKILEV